MLLPLLSLFQFSVTMSNFAVPFVSHRDTLLHHRCQATRQLITESCNLRRHNKAFLSTSQSPQLFYYSTGKLTNVPIKGHHLMGHNDWFWQTVIIEPVQFPRESFTHSFPVNVNLELEKSQRLWVQEHTRRTKMTTDQVKRQAVKAKMTSYVGFDRWMNPRWQWAFSHILQWFLSAAWASLGWSFCKSDGKTPIWSMIHLFKAPSHVKSDEI